MKIFVDENIPVETVEALRANGHDVLDIRGTADEGMDDEFLWARSQSEERLLVTTDKGFTKYRDTAHFGLLIVRLRQPKRSKIHKESYGGDLSVWRGPMEGFAGRGARWCQERFSKRRIAETSQVRLLAAFPNRPDSAVRSKRRALPYDLKLPLQYRRRTTSCFTS
jgi:hypothetical protein